LTRQLLLVVGAPTRMLQVCPMLKTTWPPPTATEAGNRLIKDAARIAFGFRNLDNQRRRVRLHCKRTIIS
jgi:hypothetical protein